MGDKPQGLVCYNSPMQTPPAKPAPSTPDETQRRGALVLHVLPIMLIPVLVSATTFMLLRLAAGDQFQPPAGGSIPFNPLVLLVVIVVFLSALIILVRLGQPTLSALLIIGVWTLLTTLGALRSGVESFFPALLIIPICAAGLLIDRFACISLAALGALLVSCLAWLQRAGYVLAQPPPPLIAANETLLAVVFWIAIFTTVAALTALLAGGLQRALAQSRAQAQALRELSSQLEARVAEQTAHILDQERAAATLAERTRLAREIHDTLAQGLTGIVVQLSAAQRAQAAGAAEAGEHIGLARDMAREALAEARRSVWNLRAPALERGDLGDALRSLAARPIDPHVRTTFEQRGEPWPLPPAVESALLRVAQEARANAARHAQASQVRVELEYLPAAVRLSVGDDGVGFAAQQLADAPAVVGSHGGFGLLGMRERLAALGGTLELASDGGAQVVAVVPKG